MSAIGVEIVPDPAASSGGSALIRLNGVWLLPPKTTFRIEPLEDDGETADEGWPAGELLPRATRVTQSGIELLVGPEVVDAPALIPGTPVVLTIPAADIREELRWPSLPLSSKPRRRAAVLSSETRAAELAAEAAHATQTPPARGTIGDAAGDDAAVDGPLEPPAPADDAANAGNDNATTKPAAAAAAAAARAARTRGKPALHKPANPDANGDADDIASRDTSNVPETIDDDAPDDGPADNDGAGPSQAPPRKPLAASSDRGRIHGGVAASDTLRRVNGTGRHAPPRPAASPATDGAEARAQEALARLTRNGTNHGTGADNGNGTGTGAGPEAGKKAGTGSGDGTAKTNRRAQPDQHAGNARPPAAAHTAVTTAATPVRADREDAQDAPLPAVVVEHRRLSQHTDPAAHGREPIGARERRPRRALPFLFGFSLAAALALGSWFALNPSNAVQLPWLTGANTAVDTAAVAARPPARPSPDLEGVLALTPRSPAGVDPEGVDLEAALRRADENLHSAAPDRDEASFWLKYAVRLGLGNQRLTWALTQLGTLYASGHIARNDTPTASADDTREPAPDFATARLLWQIAAAKGDPVATCFLASLHEHGLSVERSTSRALELFRTAKTRGGCRGNDDAIRRLEADPS